MALAVSWPYPTILVAGSGFTDRQNLVAVLRHEGYLVLICPDDAAAVDVVRLHSRPIQVMVTGEDGNSRSLAAKLLLYRPQMRVLYMTHDLAGNDCDVSAPDLLLQEIREILKPASKDLSRRVGAA